MPLTAFLTAAEATRGRKLMSDEALRLWQLYWRNRKNEMPAPPLKPP